MAAPMRNHAVAASLLLASFAQAEVSPSGAFTTRVPIEVPRFHGLEPALALSYDSNRGNGPLGVGWALAGLSAVQRGSAGKGVPGYDGGDVFFVDGAQLLPCVTGSLSPGCNNPTGAGG